jgi:hypothetical protein
VIDRTRWVVNIINLLSSYTEHFINTASRKRERAREDGETSRGGEIIISDLLEEEFLPKPDYGA